jgi:amino acid transporter
MTAPTEDLPPGNSASQPSAASLTSDADAGSTVSLQQQVDARTAPEIRRFGTFAGVFTPTLLTVLGVIMYLREGWVVGNAGLLGAWLIVLLAASITGFTGLSMSSITTNIRIGAGGAFSIISQSLGLEVGGSIGIPLYLAQALAVALYIFGFREGWLMLFPNHPAIVVDLGTFAALFVIAFISANLAFRVQYVILAIVAGSLISVLATFFTGVVQYPPALWGSFSTSAASGSGPGTAGFWQVFAVFFPAVTGIMSGANMSGELKNPRRSIPIGTMAAIGLSTVIYLVLAYWLSRVASPSELVSNYTVMIDKALWPPIVLAGLLGATFSSGLASLVGAPRVLQALAVHDIVPGSETLAKKGSNSEPRNAMWFTAIIVLVGLMLRDLNAIAPLITMFFLITYAVINVVVFTEESLHLTSFRPLLRVPRAVPLLGALGAVAVMFLVSPVFSLVSAGFTLALYGALQRRQLRSPYGDVRSGLFVSVAEWAAAHVSDLPKAQERAWRPNLLIPVENTSDVWNELEFIRDLVRDRGSIRLLGLTQDRDGVERSMADLPDLAAAFRKQGVYTRSTVVTDKDITQSLIVSIQTLSGVFFRPNVLFLKGEPDMDRRDRTRLQRIVDAARANEMGVMLLVHGDSQGLGRRELITVWLRDQSPHWELDMHLGNIDLALLSAYLLCKSWQGRLRIVTAVGKQEQVPRAQAYLQTLASVARLPGVDVHVEHGDLLTTLEGCHGSDLNILGLPAKIQPKFLGEVVASAGSACLFVQDSGGENVMA